MSQENIKDMLQGGLSLLFVAGIATVLYSHGLVRMPTLDRDTLTVYLFECTEDRVNGQCPGRESVIGPAMMKVSVEHQFVVVWMDGIPPDKLTNCTIANRANWRCDNGWAFTDGVYVETSPDKRTRYGTWWDAAKFALTLTPAQSKPAQSRKDQP